MKRLRTKQAMRKKLSTMEMRERMRTRKLRRMARTMRGKMKRKMKMIVSEKESHFGLSNGVKSTCYLRVGSFTVICEPDVYADS